MASSSSLERGHLQGFEPSEDELLDDRYLLDAFLEHSPDAVYFKDRESRFVRLSTALARRLGLTDPRAAIGRTDCDFFGAVHASKARADELALMHSGKPLVAIEEHE